MLSIASASVKDTTALGSIESLKNTLWFFYDRVGLLAEMQQRYGSMVTVRNRVPLCKSQRQFIVVSGADLNRQVLGDPETYQSCGLTIRGPRGSSLNNLRRGLISLNGEQHQDLRRLVGPLFTPKAIKEFYPQMVETVDRELETWQVNTTVDIFPRIVHLATRLSIQNLLAGAEPDDSLWMAEALTDLLNRSFDPGVLLFQLNLASTPYRKLLQCADKIQQRALQMIDRRPQSTDGPPGFLDKLIGAHHADPQRLKREELAGQIVMMFAASHETMPKAITWSLFLLTQHPQILAELQREIWTQCGDAPPSFEDLAELPLLDAVTKETMRLLPPAPMLFRRASKDSGLGDQVVRRGDYVVVSAYGTHRDQRTFSHPDQFRPERWFAPAPDKYAYLPFGAGIKMCIAKTLGTVAINLIVSMVVQRFSLAVAPNSRIDRSHRLTLEPKHGMPMMLARPNQRFEFMPVRGNVHEMVDLTRSDATTQPATLPMHSGDLPLRRAA